MITLHLVLYLLALVCFIIAAAGIASRINLIATGLALWMLSLIV